MSEQLMVSEDVEYVGFWTRLMAAAIDLFLISLIQPIPEMYSAQAGMNIGWTDFVMNYLLPAVIIIAFWRLLNTTPGKMVIGAEIVNAKTGDAPSGMQYVIRCIGCYMSICILFVGIVWIALDEKKRSWHDIVAGTVVVRKRRRGNANIHALGPFLPTHGTQTSSIACDGCGASVNGAATTCVQCGIQLTKRPRSTFGKLVKWCFIGFNVLMVFCLRHVLHTHTSGRGFDIGVLIIALIVIALWFSGSTVLGLITVFTRPKK